MRFIFWATWFLADSALAEKEARPNERHVVVVVWDGMRPDFVNETNTPALWKLAQRGVTFKQHHSVYLTATNVNGTAMATGVFPNRNGILANREFRPAIDPHNVFENADAAAVVLDEGPSEWLPWFVFGTVLAGTGFAVDTATGALFEQHPHEVFVNLEPVQAQPQEQASNQR